MWNNSYRHCIPRGGTLGALFPISVGIYIKHINRESPSRVPGMVPGLVSFLFPQQSSLVCYYSCLCCIDLVEEFHLVEEIYSFEKVGADPVLCDLGVLDL